MDFDHLFTDDSFASELIRQKARQLVRHPGFDRWDYADIEQELRTELIRKYTDFDPERACEATFIVRILDSKLISLIRSCLAAKRNFRREEHSLNETVSDAEGGSVERAQTLDASSARAHTGQSARSVEEQAQLRFDMAELLKAVPDDLRPLAELLMEMSEHAASRRLGKSRRQTAKDVTRLREIFEDADLREYL